VAGTPIYSYSLWQTFAMAYPNRIILSKSGVDLDISKRVLSIKLTPTLAAIFKINMTSYCRHEWSRLDKIW